MVPGALRGPHPDPGVPVGDGQLEAVEGGGEDSLGVRRPVDAAAPRHGQPREQRQHVSLPGRVVRAGGPKTEEVLREE